MDGMTRSQKDAARGRPNPGGGASKTMEKVIVVENKDKGWTTKYSHQKRPDHDLRMKSAIPYDKLVRPSRKAFTTEISFPK